MYEFDSVSVSSYEASSLAAKLSERSNDGWEVVSIVTAGSDIVAFLKKAGASGAAGATSSSDTGDVPGAATDASSVTEPAGWGTEPAGTSETTPAGGGDASWGTTSTSSSAPGSGASTWGGSAGSEGAGTWGGSAGGSSESGGGWGTGGSQTPSGGAPATSQAPTPSVPPGWYADPAGRYELRYWDGSAWTEHVSRAGQQYTDPPVA